MKPCECRNRRAFFAIHPDDLSAFLDGFARGPANPKGVYHCYFCPSCHTTWLVDDTTRGPMAVRDQDAIDIEHFDDRPYRRELCIDMHGGLGAERCTFRGCKNFSLKGCALCVDHIYPEYAS